MDDKTIVRRTLLLSTLAFALALCLILGIGAAAAKSRPGRIDAALARGDVARAERLTASLTDEELRLQYEKKCRYAAAAEKLACGEYQEAAALYASLGAEDEARRGYDEARYRLGLQALEGGDFDDAAALFDALGSYENAPELSKRARYEKAAQLYEAGNIYDSFLLYHALGDYDDAAARALGLASEICGREDLDSALRIAQSLTAEEVEHRLALKNAREALPQSIVDVGFYHTAARLADGRAVACGDNSFGQCDVDDWRRVVQICCGAYHTAALLNDGTVVAVGRGDEGQCDVEDWRGIVAVTAADYATFGLRSDGSVVCCGFNGYDAVDSWRDVTRISGGSYALAALRDGEALVSHESARSDELHELVDVAVNTGYAVGLRADGTVVCPAAPEDWTDIVALSAGANAFLGLDEDGNVHAHFFIGRGPDFSSLKNVRALAAGGTHYAFVTADGAVIALGDNAHGECDTHNWKLY